jgi:hypothetical protein
MGAQKRELINPFPFEASSESVSIASILRNWNGLPGAPPPNCCTVCVVCRNVHTLSLFFEIVSYRITNVIMKIILTH